DLFGLQNMEGACPCLQGPIDGGDGLRAQSPDPDEVAPAPVQMLDLGGAQVRAREGGIGQGLPDLRLAHHPAEGSLKEGPLGEVDPCDDAPGREQEQAPDHQDSRNEIEDAAVPHPIEGHFTSPLAAVVPLNQWGFRSVISSRIQRVATMAVNMLIKIPMERVTAKP